MEDIEKLLKQEFKNNNVNFDSNFRYDYVDDSFTDVLKSVIGVVEKLNRGVVSDSNQCKQCKEPIADGFRFCSGLCK